MTERIDAEYFAEREQFAAVLLNLIRDDEAVIRNHFWRLGSSNSSSTETTAAQPIYDEDRLLREVVAKREIVGTWLQLVRRQFIEPALAGAEVAEDMVREIALVYCDDPEVEATRPTRRLSTPPPSTADCDRTDHNTVVPFRRKDR
jgi:hypothetical protein